MEARDFSRVRLHMGMTATKELEDEIVFRCSDLESDDIWYNIRQCVIYSQNNGLKALKEEMDDCNIWG